MLVYSFANSEMYGPYLWKYRGLYFSLLTVAVAAMALSCYVGKDVPRRFKALNYASPLYAAFLFAWALAITYFDYHITGTVDPTVFMTFSLIVPLSAFLFPSVYAVIVTAANAILLYLTLSAGGGVGQLINSFIFFIFQIVLGISFLQLKINLAERMVAEQEKARFDVMTGSLNRRSYEEDLQSYLAAPLPENLTYIAIDINGLKDINDQYGHDAGDKMIIGAARCIEQCFGDKGRVYRIGGDEYAAILTSPQAGPEELLNAFEESMRDWSDRSGIQLTASFGCVTASELPGKDISVLAKEADARMYERKALYYQLTGRDRRRYMRK
ncbi:MAG: GGDEF domain-containing protein [Clostridia bacterium]|nr:GGDEF domain-containing protein [Clostridia bacterium]